MTNYGNNYCVLILTQEAKIWAWTKADIGRLTANELRFFKKHRRNNKWKEKNLKIHTLKDILIMK